MGGVTHTARGHRVHACVQPLPLPLTLRLIAVFCTQSENFFLCCASVLCGNRWSAKVGTNVGGIPPGIDGALGRETGRAGGYFLFLMPAGAELVDKRIRFALIELLYSCNIFCETAH